MNTEQMLDGASKLADAFSALGLTFCEIADAINRVFHTLFSTPKTQVQQDARYLKTYKIPLCRRHQRLVVRYQYIPSAPRNRPYQRRAY